jgi:Domain of unknown function (DUF4124)
MPIFRPLPRVAQPPLWALASLLLVGLALMLASPSAHAQWKWRDKNGQVTASDLPPPRDVPDKDILQRPDLTARRAAPAAPAAQSAASAASAPGLAGKPATDPELDKRVKLAEQDAAAKKKAEDDRLASQRRENCSRARNQLATLESGIRITRLNAKGEQEYIDDGTRASETKRARDIIAAECR